MIYELKAGGVDHRRLVGAKLEKLAEGETGAESFSSFPSTQFQWLLLIFLYLIIEI